MIINLIFIGIIISIIFYSLLFSAEGRKHPVPSGSEWLTGAPSPSTGLSRSFSEIVRFNFREAQQLNPYGIRIFSFFVIQLLMRLILSVQVFRTSERRLQALLRTDIVFSVILFLVCFWPFMVYTAREFIQLLR